MRFVICAGRSANTSNAGKDCVGFSTVSGGNENENGNWQVDSQTTEQKTKRRRRKKRRDETEASQASERIHMWNGKNYNPNKRMQTQQRRSERERERGRERKGCITLLRSRIDDGYVLMAQVARDWVDWAGLDWTGLVWKPFFENFLKFNKYLWVDNAKARRGEATHTHTHKQLARLLGWIK